MNLLASLSFDGGFFKFVNTLENTFFSAFRHGKHGVIIVVKSDVVENIFLGGACHPANAIA